MNRRAVWLNVYLAGERRFGRLVSDLRSLWDGVWLGLLTPAQLEALDEAYYDNEGVYVSESHNRRGLFPWESQLVGKHVSRGGRIAVLGAGGGREVMALLERGYAAWGFEPNADLAAFGSALTSADGHGDRIAVTSRGTWTAPAESYDAVLVGWGAYMLVPSRPARIALLQGASSAIGPGGVVVMSFFTMIGDRRPFHVTYRVAKFIRRLLRRPAPLMGDALVPNYAHHFTRSQIVEEVTAAGMQLLEYGVIDGGYGWAVARPTLTNEGALRD